MGAKVISEDSVKLTKTSKGIFFFNVIHKLLA